MDMIGIHKVSCSRHLAKESEIWNFKYGYDWNPQSKLFTPSSYGI